MVFGGLNIVGKWQRRDKAEGMSKEEEERHLGLRVVPLKMASPWAVYGDW